MSYFLTSTIKELDDFYIVRVEDYITSIVYKRQLKFFRKCMNGDDLPMQKLIIKQAMESNTGFSDHYAKLDSKYNVPDAKHLTTNQGTYLTYR